MRHFCKEKKTFSAIISDFEVMKEISTDKLIAQLEVGLFYRLGAKDLVEQHIS